MPSYDSTPGNLNFALQRGDDFSAAIDFSPISMVGYTVTASMSSLVTGSEVQPMTVSIVSATAGQINVSLTDTQTSLLARGSYSWSLKWVEGGGARTALSGVVEVK